MKRARLGSITFPVASLLVACLILAQDQSQPASSPGKDTAKFSTEKHKRRQKAKLRQEWEARYRNWLNEDVVYIITDDERQEFKQLNTAEECDQFIEQFWLRRDPTPFTVENEFKDEHYRRILYANERYGLNLPGWKTDRGRVYVLFGPPDEIESRTSGDGGPTYPIEHWRYGYIEGLGSDVHFEFADPTITGDFHATKDPTAIGATNINGGGEMPPRWQPFGATVDEFEGLERFANPHKTPQHMTFRELEAALTSQAAITDLPLQVQANFIKVTNATVMADITIQFENKDLQFRTKDGVESAEVNICARIATMSGRPVVLFEDTATRVVPPAVPLERLNLPTIYQKQIPIAPGMYRLDIVAKDAASGRMNHYAMDLTVPHFDGPELASSTLIVADLIEKVPRPAVGNGQFVLGTSKVRPRLGNAFRQNERLGIYIQIYNFARDEKERKPNGTIKYEVVNNGSSEKVLDFTEDAAKVPNASAQQVTIEKLVPLQTLKPGQYTLTISVTDKNRSRTISPSATFTVT